MMIVVAGDGIACSCSCPDGSSFSQPSPTHVSNKGGEGLSRGGRLKGSSRGVIASNLRPPRCFLRSLKSGFSF